MGIGAWAATAAVATGVGVAAISVLGAGITDHGVRPLTSAQVERALASPATATPVPGTAGGTAVARSLVGCRPRAAACSPAATRPATRT